jgi:hypothetical protein
MTWGARVHESCSVGARFRVREPPHAVARLLIAAARDNSQSMTRGLEPTGHIPWVPDPGCGKSEPPHAQVVRLLGAAAEDIR